MKSIILLRGLEKNQKKKWIKEENLQNFFIDYDTFNRLYSVPEYKFKTEDGILGRANTSKVFKEFLRAVINRLESGCLIVIDLELIGTSTIETLATVYGYTVFNKIFPIPQDYIGNPGKYSIEGFEKKRREDLQKEVDSFLNLQLSQTNIIESYKDLEKFWEDKYTLDIRSDTPILHFFSDIHSNYKLFSQINSQIPITEFKIFLGDYIDGPEVGGSRVMIDYVLNKVGGYSVCLEGNHEKRLRKYLYCRWVSQSSSKQKQEAMKMIWESLPEDFLCTTAKEFETMSPNECWDMIKRMNYRLVPFKIILTEDITYICTHGGIRCLEQLSPKYIGNAIYGNRDMDEYDRLFSRKYYSDDYISIHAHCKYPDKVEPFRYKKTINLDPEDETQIIYLNTKNINPFEPCIVK